ncbi:NucA/NucB deoxyribonuclease domain-containing protein [Marinithermofilum abyssi]
MNEQCDEFPFASTYEGSGNANITGVPPLLLTTVHMKVGKRNLIHWLIG